MAYLLLILYLVFLACYLDHQIVKFDDIIKKHYHWL